MREGLTVEEFITLSSIKKSIEGYFSSITGSITKYKDRWKDLTIISGTSDESNFTACKLYTQTMHLLEFQKQFSKTQLVITYFKEKKGPNKKEGTKSVTVYC